MKIKPGFEVLEPNCANARNHEPLPTGYVERRLWKLKTHDQSQCCCGLWLIYTKRKTPRTAREIERLTGLKEGA